MNKTIGAIVIGGHFQGLGVIRALAREGIPVALVDSEPCLSRFSKYVWKYFHSPKLENERDYLEFLIELASIHGLDGWIVFPTDDETVFFLSKHHKQLSQFLKVTTPPWEVSKYSYDKKRSYQLAEKIGVPIPKTYYPENIDSLDQMDVPFPAVIKPAVMRTFFKSTGKKVFVAHNKTELRDAYNQASQIIEHHEILIQDMIPEVSKNLYSFCPLFKDGEVLAKIVAKRKRQHPMDFGQASTYAETVDLPELIELGTTVLKAMKYYGIGEVEFIRDPRDNVFKFLEVNPRIWGWHTLAIHAGVNLPYYLYLDMINKPVSNGDYAIGKKWVRLTTDIPTVLGEILKGRMTLKEYTHSMQGDKTYAVADRDDPLPFFGEFMLLPYLWIKRGF